MVEISLLYLRSCCPHSVVMGSKRHEGFYGLDTAVRGTCTLLTTYLQDYESCKIDYSTQASVMLQVLIRKTEIPKRVSRQSLRSYFWACRLRTVHQLIVKGTLRNNCVFFRVKHSNHDAVARSSRWKVNGGSSQWDWDEYIWVKEALFCAFNISKAKSTTRTY